MKICFLLPSLKTGGGTRVMIELANNLQTYGNKVYIAAPNNSNEKNNFALNLDIEVLKIGKFSQSKIVKIKNLFLVFNEIKKLNIDLFIYADPFFSILAIFLPRKKCVRFIQADDYSLFDDRSLIKSKILLIIYKLLVKLSYKYKVNYLFNSHYTYNKFLTISNRKDVKNKLIHPAINLNIFNNLNTRDDNQLNICLFVRPHPLKGFKYFLQAWSSLDEVIKKKVTNVFIVSNDNLDNYDFKNFTRLRPKSDIEISEILNKSHIFVFTSISEGFGLPPLEAMACGCSVILSDCGGINEYAINEKNCLMYSPLNYKELSNKISSLIENKEMRIFLSQNAITTAKKFNWNDSFRHFLDFCN